MQDVSRRQVHASSYGRDRCQNLALREHLRLNRRDPSMFISTVVTACRECHICDGRPANRL